MMHPETEAPLLRWFRVAEAAHWTNFAETRKTFPDADQVRVTGKRTATVFNVSRTGNRIIAAIDYRYGFLYVRFVLTHDAYAKGAWKQNL